eukprot:CAMPEP_0119134228 /NCGR_PEP_ID=MMETSP1310-20130426/16061_1 /TAXON_ID=464262 /ORGANISM="Genus nov. species nov., Strain RCC2339" /LENGTH=130 /DNA_ID=CAMNT_0007124995 /DNA_START=92 /DNA_END=480 /DNA_ORIENTATION=-
MTTFVKDQVSSLWNSHLTEIGRWVEKATQDTESPTPGYVHHELAKYTHQSLEESRMLEALLMKKLETNAPRVKLKALKCVKFVVEKGHPSFGTDFKTPGRIEAIQNCLQYHGPPDPILGDSLYRSVRDEA